VRRELIDIKKQAKTVVIDHISHASESADGNIHVSFQAPVCHSDIEDYTPNDDESDFIVPDISDHSISSNLSEFELLQLQLYHLVLNPGQRLGLWAEGDIDSRSHSLKVCISLRKIAGALNLNQTKGQVMIDELKTFLVENDSSVLADSIPSCYLSIKRSLEKGIDSQFPINEVNIDVKKYLLEASASKNLKNTRLSAIELDDFDLCGVFVDPLRIISEELFRLSPEDIYWEPVKETVPYWTPFPSRQDTQSGEVIYSHFCSGEFYHSLHEKVQSDFGAVPLVIGCSIDDTTYVTMGNDSMCPVYINIMNLKPPLNVQNASVHLIGFAPSLRKTEEQIRLSLSKSDGTTNIALPETLITGLISMVKRKSRQFFITEIFRSVIKVQNQGGTTMR
jgi:hypothetical protein